VASFLRELRIASFLVVLLIAIGMGLPNLLAALPTYRPAWMELACMAALLTAVVTDGLLLAWHRTWGRARWPVAVTVLAVSIPATTAVPAEVLLTPAHLAMTFVGWIGVLLFAEAGLGELGAFLGLNYALTATLLVAAGRTDQESLTHYALVVIVVGGFQLALGTVGVALQKVAATAADANRRRHETATAESVAELLHADRSRRYAALQDTAASLLQGIIDGRLRPGDAGVQRRCAVEAARMRRLFAETDDVADPLLHELDSVVDVAERTGVIVTRTVLGSWPHLAQQVRRTLVDEAAAALLDARTHARLTVNGERHEVVLSVVTDGRNAQPGQRSNAGVEISTLIDGERVWMQARWTPTPAATGGPRQYSDPAVVNAHWPRTSAKYPTRSLGRTVRLRAAWQERAGRIACRTSRFRPHPPDLTRLAARTRAELLRRWKQNRTWSRIRRRGQSPR
jgi:hypothetical protein